MKAQFQLTALLSVIFFSVAAQGVWTQKANFVGGAVTEARAFGIGNKGYFGAVTPDLWEYDPVADTWTQMAAFIGPIRYSAAGFSIGTKGYFGTGNSFNDFYEYDQATNTWTQKANFGGSGREGAVGCAINGMGYIGLGGSYLNDWWEYDPNSNAWTQKANLGGPGRYHAGCFTIGGKGYVCTGFNGSFFNDLWEYDPVNNTWTQMANMPAVTRDRPVGMSVGTKGYIVSGWTGGMALNDAWEWDQPTNTWTQLPSCPGAPRYNACGFSAGLKIYFGTGYVSGGSDDFWEYGSNCSLQAASQATSCNGNCDGSATVTFPDSNAVASYLWSNGNTTQSISGICAGNYIVTVTDTTGCTSNFVVTVSEPPAIVAASTSTQPTCFGSIDGGLCAVPSGGVPPYVSYLWSTTATTQCIQNIGAGSYTVTIADTNGCTGVSTLTLAQPAAIILNISHTDATCATCPNGTASASLSGGVGPYSYSWSNGATSAFITGLLPGMYTCCVTDNNGCTACDSVGVGNLTSVNESNLETELHISPNPFNEDIFIECNSLPLVNCQLLLRDHFGRIIGAKYVKNNGTIIINSKDLRAGVYILEFGYDTNKVFRKLVKY
ncbi:MAG: kelch repeat-containing protein [Bacteroidia bacterium]